MKVGVLMGLYLHRLRFISPFYLFDSLRIINHVLYLHLRYPIRVLRLAFRKSLKKFRLENSGITTAATTEEGTEGPEEPQDGVAETIAPAEKKSQFAHLRYWHYNRADIATVREIADPKKLSWHLGRRYTLWHRIKFMGKGKGEGPQ